MKCDHCLRGNPQRKDMDVSILRQVLMHFDDISSVVLTGGEPMLKPELIIDILNEIRWSKTKIGNLYIVTNGTHYNQELVDYLNNFWTICYDNEISGLEISMDQFHDKDKSDKIANNIEKYDCYCNKYLGTRGNIHSVISQGRAEDWGDRKLILYEEDALRYEDFGNYKSIMGMFYLNVEGNICQQCDLSYKNQKKEKLCNYKDLYDFLYDLQKKEIDDSM